jgi:hypothetical protein
METTPHVTAIREALEAVAGDDEQAQALAHRMATALAPALHLQLLDLLGEVALEASRQLPEGRLDLQLAGRDAVLVYRPEPGVDAPTPVDEGSETARLTVRMPEALKASIEAAADAEGVSTNAWLVAAARHHLSPTAGPRKGPASTGRRITGYVQG